MPDNPFLEGAFAPVEHESTHVQLPLSGQLPTDLNGVYIRNGPNPLHVHNPKKHHWFVGDGMVHGIRLSQGQALWYRNRYVGGNKLHKALGRTPIAGKPRGLFDTVNTNVFAHAGRIWASVEAGPLPIELNTELLSLRHALFNSQQSLPYTAHPHLDPVSGDLHAICYDATQLKKLFYIRVDRQGEVDKVITIPVKNGPMVHDCAITRSKVVVLDLPVTLSLWEAVMKRSAFPYKWNPKHPARVGLLPRDGQASDIRWLNLDPCFVFHTCNAYDLSDGSVVMDVVVHERMFDASTIGPEAQRVAVFERWTMPANGSKVIREVVSTRSQEFPRLNETLVGQTYQYAYTTEFSVDPQGGQSLLKHDMHTRQTSEHRFSPHQKAGEFVFVPRPSKLSEDDGWLMGYVYNLHKQQGEFHVLDAQDMNKPAQAIVHIPSPVPMGFHGNWVAESAVSAQPV